MPKIYTPDLMEEMYGVMEKKNSSYDGFSRGNLITINGKTIREKMLDEYFVREGEQDDFDYYYQKNVAQKTQEYVEEALQKNQYVEMFEFGEDGLLSEDPIPLVDKENAQVQIDEQYRQKIMESRQQIKLHHFSGQWRRTIDEMDGDLSNNHLSEKKRQALKINDFVNPCRFSLERQALSTLVRLRLGAQGHRLEDILNPDKLQEEKKRAREEVLEHLRPKADLELLAKEIAGIIKEKELGELTEEEIRSLVPKTEETLTKKEIEEEQQERGELLDEHDLKAMSYDKTAKQMGEKATKLLQKKLPKGTEPKSVELNWGMIGEAVRRMSWQVHEEDAQWLTEQLLWGCTQLLDQIDTRFRNVDWSNDLKLMDPRLADVYAVCFSMFDYAQEIERVYKAAPDLVLKSAEKICKEHPELGSAQQLYDATMVRGSIVGKISSYMKDYAGAIGKLSTGYADNYCNIVNIMEADTFRRALIAANGPQSGVSMVLDEQTSKNVMDMANEFWGKELKAYTNFEDPDILRLMTRECFSGKLQKNHQISYDDKTKKFSITGKVTPEMEFAKELEDNSQFVAQKNWLRSKWNSLTEENTEERYGIYREHFTEIVTDMLEDIKNVDPALMRSSQQFRDMKRDLKQLKTLLQEGTQNDPAVEMRKACKQLLESTQAYLEYKEADNIGKDRSKQEFKRILTAQRVLKMSKMMDDLSRELPTQPEIEQWRNRRPKNEKEQAAPSEQKNHIVFEEKEVTHMGLENFKKKAEKDLEQSKKGIDNLLDFAKPKAEVKTESNYAKDLINQITYEVPEGMTEEVAIAVALGVLADNKLLRGLVTGSTAMALSTDAFNRSYMFMNALHGDPERADQFYFVMPKARELARQAFEKYKSGDKSDIERYAENVMRVADELVLGPISEKEGSNAQSFVCKCADTLYKNGYGKAAISSQVNLDKLRSRVAFQELKREALIQSIRFADLFSEADSLEREEALLTIMAEKSINNNNLFFQKIETEIGSIAEEHFSEELEDPEKCSTISIEQRNTVDAMKRNVLFPDEFMFADPQRKAVYVDAVKKYIRTTDNFKKLLEADEKQFEENFNSLSKVRLTEAQIYEMLGEENRKMFELENQSNAGKQDAIRDDFIQHTKERAEEWVRQEKQREKAENAIYRKNADAIQKTLLSNLKKIYGDEAGEQEILFYVDGGEASKLEVAVKNVLEGRSIYLKQPGSGIMVQLTPKNQKNGKISLEKSETTAFRYSGEQAVNNIYTMKRNVELARKITLPHKFGSLPAMEKLSFCKRQLVDAAHGIDMGADYRAVIDAIKGVEQYYQGLHAPKEDGTYPVFEAGDKERLQRAFDSVLQMVSEYQKVNLTGMVMDAVKDAAQEGQRYLDELQLDERKMSLKDRIVMQEPSNINIREICETNSKKLKEVYDALSQTEGFFHGSKQQYKDMKQALEQLVQAGKEEPDTARYQTLLNNMRDAVNNYIDYKKDDLGSDTSRSRYALAGQLKQLTAIARKEFFEGLEMQNEWDLMDVNRKIAKAAESPVEPELLEQLQSISGSLKENLASADKRIMTQQKEGITKELQKDMIKYEKVAAERKTISNQLEKYCGAQASDIYRIPGSMLKETQMLIDEKGVMHEEPVSVMDKLKQEILSNKELLISYAVDKKPISGDEMATLRLQMAQMVAMESIASERMKMGYREGQKRVAPGAFEKAYADNPEKCLKEIEKTDVFQYAMENMTPENMLLLYENDGAKIIAETLVQEAVKKNGMNRMRENEKLVSEHLDKCMKSDSPSVYTDQLKQGIMSNKELMISYLCNKPVTDQQMVELRGMMVQMVALECMKADHKAGETGEQEKAFANDPKKYLAKIEESVFFHFVADDMSQEKMRIFIEEDVAEKVAENLLEKGVLNEKANEAGNDMQTVQKKQSDVSMMV